MFNCKLVRDIVPFLSQLGNEIVLKTNNLHVRKQQN